MVLDLCGGTPSEITVAGNAEPPETIIDFPQSELERLAGLDVPLAEMRRVLEQLGFFVAGQGERVKIAVPSWRPDVQGKADIVEEVVRIVGVDQRAARRRFRAATRRAKPVLTPIQVRTRKAKRALAARSLVEAVTWSFIAKAQAELFGGGSAGTGARQSDRGRTVRHAAEPHSGPGRGGADATPIAAFPMSACSRSGRYFAATSRRISSPPPPACAARWRKPSGIGRHWSKREPVEVDAFDAKADALAVLTAAGAPTQALQVVPGGPAWFHPGRSGTIQIGPQNVLGHFGELHPRALEALDAEGPLVGFEVILEQIPEPKAKATRAKPVLELSAFQPVERDFAFVVERSVKAADIVRAAQSVDKQADRRRHRVRSSTKARASSPARNRSPSRSRCSRATRP